MKIYNVNSIVKFEHDNGDLTAYPKHIIMYKRIGEVFEFRELLSNSNITEQLATDIDNQAGTAYADGDAVVTALDGFLGI